MNATLFGPFDWDVLHGIAPYLGGDGASQGILRDAFMTVIRGLATTKPCSACQKSIGGFLAIAQASPAFANRTLTQVLVDGDAVAFVRALHELVELKLSKQRWLATSGLVADALVDALVDTESTSGVDVKAVLDAPEFVERVGLAMIKTPSLAVQSMRQRARSWLYGGRPFAIESVWMSVLLMAFFHEFTTLENGTALPEELPHTFRALAVLSSAWYEDDAQILAELANATEHLRQIQLRQLGLKGLSGGAQVTKAARHTRSHTPTCASLNTSLPPLVLLRGGVFDSDFATALPRLPKLGAIVAHVPVGMTSSSLHAHGPTSDAPFECDCAPPLAQLHLPDTDEDSVIPRLFDLAIYAKQFESSVEHAFQRVSWVSETERNELREARELFASMRASRCNPTTCA